MKKTLNETSVINELTGHSSFFKATTPPPAQTVYHQEGHRTEVTVVRSPSRSTKRHPFEIYEDQLVKLQRLSAQSVLDGHKRGMSEMVRQALDIYLESHQ